MHTYPRRSKALQLFSFYAPVRLWFSESKYSEPLEYNINESRNFKDVARSKQNEISMGNGPTLTGSSEEKSWLRSHNMHTLYCTSENLVSVSTEIDMNLSNLNGPLMTFKRQTRI